MSTASSLFVEGIGTVVGVILVIGVDDGDMPSSLAPASDACSLFIEKVWKGEEAHTI